MFFRVLNILNDIKSLIFPEICFGCNDFLLSSEKTLCTTCRHFLPVTNFHNTADNPVKKVFYGRVVIENATSFIWFHKNSIVQQLIHNLKYKGFEEIGAFLGEWYGYELSASPLYKNIDFVLPVPLHPKKLKKRKYNQVAEFARGISNIIGATYRDDILIQTKKTTSQTKKRRVDRWREKKNAYEITKGINFAGKHILLVDDVITTGATIEACTKVLKNHQNCKVSIATIAITA